MSRDLLARLAREQHHAPLADLGPLPASEQQLDLFLAANQRCSGHPQGLEPAIDRACTDDSPNRRRIAEARYGHAPEREIFEESTDEAVGAAVDDHRIRLG